jgi:hypothetical protein
MEKLTLLRRTVPTQVISSKDSIGRGSAEPGPPQLAGRLRRDESTMLAKNTRVLTAQI